MFADVSSLSSDLEEWLWFIVKGRRENSIWVWIRLRLTAKLTVKE